MSDVILGRKPEHHRTHTVERQHETTEEERLEIIADGVSKMLRKMEQMEKEVEKLNEADQKHHSEISDLKGYYVDLKANHIGFRTHPETPQEAPRREVRPDPPIRLFAQEEAPKKRFYEPEATPEPESKEQHPADHLDNFLDDEGNPVIHAHNTSLDEQAITKLKAFGFVPSTIPTEVNENWWYEEAGKIYGSHDSRSVYDEKMKYHSLKGADIMELGYTLREAVAEGDWDTITSVSQVLPQQQELFLTFWSNGEELRLKHQVMNRDIISQKEAEVRGTRERVKEEIVAVKKEAEHLPEAKERIPHFDAYRDMALKKMETYCITHPQSKGYAPNMKNCLKSWMDAQGINREYYQTLWDEVEVEYKDAIAEFEAKPLEERLKAGTRGRPKRESPIPKPPKPEANPEKTPEKEEPIPT